jgi:hypothetical protein
MVDFPASNRFRRLLAAAELQSSAGTHKMRPAPADGKRMFNGGLTQAEPERRNRTKKEPRKAALES